MPRPVHFELPAEDPKRAAAFYKDVFAWDTQQWENSPYWLVDSGPESEPGINGAIGQKSEEFAVPVFVIGVDDIEAAMASVEQAGASIVVGKNPIPGIGYSAYFNDTEGNRIGLFEGDESVTA